MSHPHRSSPSQRRRPGGRPDAFPVHVLKRVDRPTTGIHDAEVRRVDERDGGFRRAARGEYGERVRVEYERFMEKHPLSDALLAMSKVLSSHVSGTERAVPGPVPDDPAAMSRHIKHLAHFLRADAVGICRLPPYAVFTHSRWDGAPIELTHRYAIAVLVDQDYPTSRASTGSDWVSNSMSFLAYSNSAFIACVMADYIRRLGFPARAHHVMNYQVVLPPILLWAGLGEMCRIGDLVLHPWLGPRFKGAVVTTDLPLEVDKPIDFGLRDFCRTCGKCARECPAQAISAGSTVWHNGYEKWPVDVKRCTSFRTANQRGSGCGTCIKVCPWNKPFTPLHRAVNWALRHIPASRSLAVKADDWFGYGRAHPEDRWWLDLEDVGGILRTPPASSGR